MKTPQATHDCPPADAWQRWLDGTLPGAERGVCDRHVEHCHECHSLLDRLTEQPAWFWLGDLPGDVNYRFAASLGPRVPGIEILEEVGRGGHGVVFRAEQRGLSRVVALKVLRHGIAASLAERDRLVTESATLARLRHPNIVQVYDCGEADGLPYLIMEWVDGGSLAARLNDTPMAPVQAAAIVEIVARAVHAAHEAGIVHRDLKPANILLKTDSSGGCNSPARAGTPMVSDFGLAKFLDLPAQLTPTIAILGTPSYMAPEQADGESRAVGPAADVYALGAILYELLTGRPPFVAASPFETLLQVRQADPVSPRRLQPTVPRDLETVCLHCLHKDPARRYASAADLAADMHRASSGVPIRARPVGRMERLLKWVRRNPKQVLMIAAVLAVGVAVAVVWPLASRRAADAARARALVDGLLASDAGEVLPLIQQLEPLRPYASKYLEERAATAPPDSRAELNARLALLPVEPDQLTELVRRLPTSQPTELLLIREAIQARAADAVPALWKILEATGGDPAGRFRAACALAGLASADARWPAVAPMVARWLAEENPLLVGRWSEALRPVGDRLVVTLGEIARDAGRPLDERVTAASVVADFAARQPTVLADLLLQVEPRPYLVLLPALKRKAAAVGPVFTAEIERTLPAGATEPQKDALAKRQVLAAVALWHLGAPATLEAFFELTGVDVRRRYYAIHLVATLGVSPSYVVDHLTTVATPVARRSLLLALGEYPVRQFGPGRQVEMRPLLERFFRDDADAGVHSATEWLVRRAWSQKDWLADIQLDLEGRPPTGRQWLVTAGGVTMSIVNGPVEFQFGSAPDEPHREGEPLFRHRIGHKFALATREVTVAEFGRFLEAHPESRYSPPEPDDRRPEFPVRRVPWHLALQYCRWLCEQEGIPEAEMPYPPVDQIKDGVAFPARFLTRTGYRLPTEDEWECAVRAGTETPRFFGYDFDILYHYAWLLANAGDSCHAGGTLRPNDLGLFDVYGNVWEWTQPTEYGPAPGKPGLREVINLDRPYVPKFDASKDVLIARGGSYLYHAPFVRSAKRYMLAPGGDTTIGFRIARTLPDNAPR